MQIKLSIVEVGRDSVWFIIAAGRDLKEQWVEFHSKTFYNILLQLYMQRCMQVREWNLLQQSRAVKCWLLLNVCRFC